MIVTVTAAKGGTAKTTTAVHLAELAAIDGRTVLLDADPQQTAMRWAALAADDGDPLRVEVLNAATPDLGLMIRGLDADVAHVIIDTPPGGEDIRQAALEAADIAVMPFTPSPTDVSMLPQTSAIVARYGKPALVLLTMAETRGRDTANALAALEAADIPVFDQPVRRLAPIRRAFGTRPKWNRSLGEYDSAWKELEALDAEMQRRRTVAVGEG